MKKTKLFGVFAVLFGAGMLLGLLSGCKDSLTKENSGKDITDGKTAYICVAQVNASRAVRPDITIDTIADFEFMLSGGKVGETLDTLGEYNSLSKLQSASVAIDTGIYWFALTATKGGTTLVGTIDSQEIEPGENTLSFNLKWKDDDLYPETLGSFVYTLDFSAASNAADVKCITGELKAFDSVEQEDSALSDDRYAETVLTPSNGKITYSLDDVPAGFYHIYIHFYADETRLAPMLSPYPALASITGGVTSKGSDKITNPFDTVYSITLNNLNDVPEDNLPTKYTIDSADITLPVLEKAGWHFNGWYAEEDFSGSEITEIPSGSTGDKVFYAKWSVATISVSIEPIADLSLTALPNEEDNTVTFTVSGAPEGSTYDWYVDGLAAEASGDTFVLEPNAIGTKTYVVEVISGTRSATATAQITATKVKSRSSIVLYDLDVSNSKREFESPTPGFYVYSDFDSIKTTSIEDAKLQDITNANDNFAIDPVTQTIYTLSGSNIYKHTNFAGKNTEKIISGIDYTVQSMCAYDSNVYLLKNAGGTDNALIRIAEDGTAVTLAYGNTSGNILDHSMSFNTSRIEVYKNNLYFVSMENGTLSISQIPINGNELGTSNTITASNFNNTGVEIYSLNITDIQAIDGKDSSVNLYILCNSKNIQRYESSSYLRGGIITVNVKNDTLAFTNFDGTALENSGKPNIFGWYDDSLDKAIAVTEYTKSYFYGPSRFVARKPDELIIVDEGNYYIDSEGKLFEKEPDGTQILVNKNSIVTVSLIDFAITDRTDIDLGFEINLNPSFNTYKGNGYVAESYRNTSYKF